ncbi:MAG: glycosyltransferase [Actinobacteria bacterium]|nr:glycosyltransferase [Actinomycetota bacterium]
MNLDRVIIYGEDWRGSMPRAFSQALWQLGYQNTIFDYTKFLAPRNTNLFARKMSQWLDKINSPRRLTAINDSFVELTCSFRPELVMVFKGLHVLPDTIRSIQKLGSLVINCHVDEFFNPTYTRPYTAESFQLYDMHFSMRPHLFDEYRRKGARAICFYECAYDPTVFYPLSVNGQSIPRCQVSFVGSWSPYRTELIESLAGLDAEVHIWGWGWNRARRQLSKYSNIKIWNRLAYREDFCKVIAGSDICLNILTPDNRDQSNLRNFEIPACGGFQLAQRSRQILQTFAEDRNIACYDGPEELRSKVVHFIKHPDQRKDIQHAGHELVTTAGHSFTDRCRSVLEQVSNLLALPEDSSNAPGLRTGGLNSSFRT